MASHRPVNETAERGDSAGDRDPVKNLHLVVADLDRARDELLTRGVAVGGVIDVGGGVRYAGFEDLDGNTFLLQEMAWRTGDDL